MTLVDTSVWINHLRRGDERLSLLLNTDEVLTHPFVVGELSLGTMRNRVQFMELLGSLPQLPLAEHGEVLALVQNRRLIGAGIGWIDAHLLASALTGNARILTADRPLAKVCRALGLGEP